MTNAPSKWAVVKVSEGEGGTHLYATDDIEFFPTETAAHEYAQMKCAHDTRAMYAVLAVTTVVRAKPVVVEAVY